MSGWQRIGVVVSVLWLVAFPIYLMIDQNNRASEIYGSCFSIAYQRYGPGGWDGNHPDKLKEREDECSRAYSRMSTSPERLVQVLIGGDKDSWVFWLIILGPLALFWAIGGTVIATVRWIRRGFPSSKKA